MDKNAFGFFFSIPDFYYGLSLRGKNRKSKSLF